MIFAAYTSLSSLENAAYINGTCAQDAAETFAKAIGVNIRWIPDSLVTDGKPIMRWDILNNGPVPFRCIFLKEKGKK